MEVYTIGHSTRSFDEFLSLLRAHGIEAIADVRGMPGSSRYPHFNSQQLEHTLPAHGIAYRHIAALGGRRGKPRADSPNAGWHNESFRAYADYMLTPQFQSGLEELLAMARESRTAIMCAEAVPWRCHRWLISDALVARGVNVEHILSRGKTRRHEITRWARVEDGRVSYPAVREELATGDPR